MREYFQKGFAAAIESNCAVSALHGYLDGVSELILTDTQLNEAEIQKLSTQLESGAVHSKNQKERVDKNLASLNRLIESREDLIATKELERFALNDRISASGTESDHFLSFAIGSIITLLLTIYLLLFYSSTGFSMLYDVPNTGNGIFNPSVFSIALSRGGGAFGFVILFPVIFLAVGFAMYITLEKYNQAKNQQAISWVGLIVFTTFIMDAIIGYKIAHGIYIRDYNNGLHEALWSATMVFSDINFYLVLIMGFVAYLIWGFLLNYILTHPYRQANPSELETNAGLIALQDELIEFVDKRSILEINSKNLTMEYQVKSLYANKIKRGEIPDALQLSLLEKAIEEFIQGYLSYANNALTNSLNRETKLAQISAVQKTWFESKIKSIIP